MATSTVITLNQNEYLWVKGDLAHSFWFTLRGNMQQQVQSGDVMKLSNTVDQG